MIISENSGGSFPQPPIGLENATCVGVIDLGTQATDLYPKPRRQVLLLFELQELIGPEGGEHEGEPFRVSLFATASLNAKSTLRKYLESWRGQAFTADELAGFDLKKLLGHVCTLNLGFNSSGKVTVQGIARVRKGDKIPPAKSEPVYFTFSEFNKEIYMGLHEWIRAIIAKSPEYRAATGLVELHDGQPVSRGDDGISDDDLPF